MKNQNIDNISIPDVFKLVDQAIAKGYAVSIHYEQIGAVTSSSIRFNKIEHVEISGQADLILPKCE